MQQVDINETGTQDATTRPVLVRYHTLRLLHQYVLRHWAVFFLLSGWKILIYLIFTLAEHKL